MASKPPAVSPGSSGSLTLAQHPPSIDLSNKVLSSAIPLPLDASVVYAAFSPTTSPTLHADTVEVARRRIIDIGKPSLLDSLLCTVYVEKGTQQLYVFSIISTDGTGDLFHSLRSLHFDGLISSQISSFRPSEIHDYKPAFSTRNRSPSPQHHLSSPHAIDALPSLFPAETLRIPYSLFVKAVQERLINDICSVPGHDRRLCRLNGGFLIFPQRPTSDWGTGWEHHAQNRPLIHTHLHVTLNRTRILVQPLLRPTHHVPISSTSPLPSGTPITLLPYGTPAYYLTSYSGPTASLVAQFKQSLSGLGCESWAALAPKSPVHPTHGTNAGHHTMSRDPRFLIAWIDVQNRQGEDKGLTVIWPIALSLSFLPSSASPHASHQLSHVPDLSSQLQPSPPPPTATVPVTDALAAAFASSPITPLGRSPPLPLTPTDLPPALTRRINVPIPYAAPFNPVAGGLSLFQFEPDSSSRDDVRAVAGEVGEYIDAVVKERERERERLRRERESSGPSVDASPARAMSVVNTPGSVGISSPMSTTLIGTMSSPPMIGPDIAIASQIPLANPLSAGADPPPQPFYPSPPQSNSVPPASSTEMIAQPLSASSTLLQHFPPPVDPSVPTDPPSPDAVTFSAASAPASSFDGFPGFDNWTQDSAPWQSSTNGILGIPLGDVGIGVGMGIDSLPYGVDPIAGGSGSGGWETNNMGRMDIDGAGIDSIFTDADFDFWDDGKPQQASISSASARVPPPLNITSGTSLSHTAVPPALTIPPQLFEDTKIPVTVPTSLASAWTPGTLSGSFVQLSSVLDVTAEMILSSPTKTLSSSSVPATPCQVALDPAVRLVPRSPMAGGGVFDAIPFASTYRVTDGKYIAGKFALPSPPDEEDRTHSIIGPSSPQRGSWRSPYAAATDPRVGVVRKLIGIKRKSALDDCERSEWVRGSREWARNVMQTPPPEEGYSPSDDSESDDDEMQVDEDEDDEVTSPVSGSRPFTPLPSYLPLGPTLLHTHFQHSHLLPHCTPLRQPRAAASPPGQTPGAAPVSVPTPVSPAALLGAASEKSKSLEAAAQILAKEVVESATWNEAWRANAVDSWTEHRCVTEVWQADVRCVANALATLPGLESPLDLQSVFTSEKGGKPELEQLESPFLSVAKSDALIHVLPTALRFWDKLGLSPRAGKKNVCAFVFFEELDEARVDTVEKWLQWVSSTYTRHNFGEHELGKSSICVRDGLIPVKFETFRKTLSSFVADLPSSSSNYVFYIAMPSSSISLFSQTLRQVFSAVKRAQRTRTQEQILFQFIPAQLVYSLKFSSAGRGGVFAFACSIYNRILSSVDRVMSQQIVGNSLRTRDFFQEPAFSLARPLHAKVHFVRQFPVLSLDVVDRHTLLHLGYRLSSCGKWVFACCVDQRGEAHDLAVRLLPNESPEAFIAQHLWAFVVGVAKRASVEWRIVIAKLGSMDTRELEAWTYQLDTSVPSCKELPMVHVSLVSVEVNTTWTFIAPHGDSKRSTSESRTSKSSTGSTMIDASSVTYRLSHDAQTDLLPPSISAGDFESTHSCIPDCSDIGPPPYERHLRPLRSATLIRVPSTADLTAITMLHVHQLHSARSPNSSLTLSDADTLQDVCQNYYELSVLARARWIRANPILPFHFGALEIIDRALRGSLTPPDL